MSELAAEEFFQFLGLRLGDRQVFLGSCTISCIESGVGSREIGLHQFLSRRHVATQSITLRCLLMAKVVETLRNRRGARVKLVGLLRSFLQFSRLAGCLLLRLLCSGLSSGRVLRRWRRL